MVMSWTDFVLLPQKRLAFLIFLIFSKSVFSMKRHVLNCDNIDLLQRIGLPHCKQEQDACIRIGRYGGAAQSSGSRGDSDEVRGRELSHAGLWRNRSYKRIVLHSQISVRLSDSRSRGKEAKVRRHVDHVQQRNHRWGSSCLRCRSCLRLSMRVVINRRIKSKKEKRKGKQIGWLFVNESSTIDTYYELKCSL